MILFQLLLAISYYQFISFFQYEKIKIIWFIFLDSYHEDIIIFYSLSFSNAKKTQHFKKQDLDLC